MENQFFSIIIPTMWKSEKIHQMMDLYQNNELVKEIIIIDNDPSKKPNLDNYPKVIYYTEGKNLFVNPSWNIGVSLSNYNLILANDDIVIQDLTKILKSILLTEFDIIGTQLGEINDNFKIDSVNKFPRNCYGVFMYIKKYTYIPEQIKIWAGDNILFDKSKNRGVFKNAGIINDNGNKVTDGDTVRYVRNTMGDDILLTDRVHYNNLNYNEEIFNIIVRTSGRKNYFKNCINSIRKFYPTAKIHVTIDDESDLEYVRESMGKLNWTYYLINNNTVSRITNKIKLNRDLKFVYNYYFNIVKPFLNGWVMYLDDDDAMIQTPMFDWEMKDVINIYKAQLYKKIVPSIQNFGKIPKLNDISTLCIIVHSKNLIDWVPNRGGDYDFISELCSKHHVIWYDTINCKIQNVDGYGIRNDISESEVINYDFNTIDDNQNDEKFLNQFIPQESNLDKLKKLMNLDERKKVEINYDSINSVLTKKDKFYETNSSVKPLRENIPQNRNEITQLKKDSLTKTSRDLFNKSRKFKG